MKFNLNDYINSIKPLDKDLEPKIVHRLNNLTKPIGSLGLLEEIVKKYCLIKNTLTPKIQNKFVFVFVSDNGVVNEGVSAYPQEVTAQMVYNFINGGACINVFSKFTNSKMYVIDIGVNADLNIDSEFFVSRKVNYGTKDISKGAAMNYDEAIKSIEIGIDILESFLEKHEIDIVIGGDMGIGNTTTAAAITSFITDKPPELVTGKGTGISDKTLEHKIRVIKTAIEINKPRYDGIDVLSKLGGFDIGGICGLILAAAKNRIPFVIDGFISGTAALIAYLLNRNIVDYCFAGHISSEPGHKFQLEFLNLKPILNLDMRLGEGTGAVLSLLIIEASIRMFNEMSTFKSAGVSKNYTNV